MELCDNILTYRKAIPSELINPGDLIMIDPDTAMVKKTVVDDFNDYTTNSRLVVGVCISSNNEAPLPLIINGGNSSNTNVNILNGGSSINNDIEWIVIDGGMSDQNSREIIQVQYAGTCVVNIYGHVDLGDELCISCEPGKAKSKDYLNKEYFYARSIGRVIKYTDNPEQVKVLLDIE